MEELVNVIASGHEWGCPDCSHLNRMIEIPRDPKQQCGECGKEFELDVDNTAHAYQ